MNRIEKTFNVVVTITDNLKCCSVTESCPTLHDPMDCSSSGFPVVQCLLEFAQIHGHWVDDAIQLSNPLPPSTFVFKSFPHQCLFQWVFESMLAVCCWITNYPKLVFKSLSIYYFTKFLWVKNSRAAELHDSGSRAFMRLHPRSRPGLQLSSVSQSLCL